MNKITTLDWLQEEDSLLKPKEIEIHDLYHYELATKYTSSTDVYKSPKRRFRIRAFLKALKSINKQNLEGKVLEIGSGDGWLSAYLVKKFGRSLDSFYSMEPNNAAIEVLIPKVFKLTSTDTSKLKLVKGSFNKIKEEEYFDCIIAMGAIHHSSNLYLTMKEVFKSLKPGGYFIFQEPTMKNETTNHFYQKRASTVENFKGLLNVKNIDRGDIIYRDCEYRTAAFHAGFDVESIKLTEYSITEFKRFIKNKFLKSEFAFNGLYVCKKPEEKGKRPITAWE